MKTKIYLILFAVISIMIIFAAWWKINHYAYADVILGITMFAQTALLISYIYQAIKKPH